MASIIQAVVDKVVGFFKKKKVKREIVVNIEKLETRVAVLENGRLEEYMIEHPDEERLVGSIFRGRIQNLEDDLQAAFVDIGLKKNAFLHYWDMTPDFEQFLDETDDDDDKGGKNGKGKGRKRNKPAKLSKEEIHQRFAPGTEITVQVTKGPISTKGPRVTTNLSIPGRYLVLMAPDKDNTRGVSRKIGDAEERKRLKRLVDRLPIPADVGIIARTAGLGAKGSSFAQDLRNLITSWNELQNNVKTRRVPCCVYQEPGLVERVVRDWLTEEIDSVLIDDEKVFEELREVTSKVSRRARNKLRRYDGPVNVFEHLGIEKQPVDVNTGHHKGKGSQEDAILEVNLEAVDEVARQLRLRNIGGLVVLDLIDMKSRKHQKQVYRALKEALRRDRARTNVLEISELGLLEMSRQRHEQSILSLLSSTCPCCGGHGVIKSPLAISIEIQRQLTNLLKKSEAENKPFEPKIVIAPAVLQRLRMEDADILKEMQDTFKTPLTFVAELHRHPESFAILDKQSGQVLYSAGGNRPTI